MRTFDAVQDRNRNAREDHPDDRLLEVAQEVPNLSPLTDSEKEVWLSCERGGLRPSEFAAESHFEPSTVRTLLSRARGKLE